MSLTDRCAVLYISVWLFICLGGIREVLIMHARCSCVKKNGNLATNLIIVRKGYITSKSSLWSCWKRPQLYVYCASCQLHVQWLDLGLKKIYIFSFLLLLLIEVLFFLWVESRKKVKKRKALKIKSSDKNHIDC